MKRRKLLRAAAMLPFLSGSLAALLDPTTAVAATRTKRRMRPSDPAWPSAAHWSKLKDEVGGNLIEVQSPFGSCEMDANGALCLDALKNIGNPLWIGDQAAGTQVSGWLDAWTPLPSIYGIKAQSAAHVAAGVNFARKNNLRLVVKGAGHSYLGTSNCADSLLIWTRAMNQVAVHEQFIPIGCKGKVTPVRAVTAGAGAVSIDLYDAVTTKGGHYVQCGGCTDTGVAGVVQSGGFGSFSKGFGLAAASLLEAEIVTADGRIRIANECTNADLFWALKGGGGGSWGVITKLTLRTYDVPQYLGGAAGMIKANSDDAFRKLIAKFFEFYETALFNPHWGEQISVFPDNSLSMSFSSQGVGREEAAKLWQPFIDWVKASPQDFSLLSEHRVWADEAQHYWDVQSNDGLTRDLRDGVPAHRGWSKGDQDQVGVFIHGLDSMWLPASLLKDKALLAQALFRASRYKRVQLHFNKGLAGSPAEVVTAAKRTAMNPAVCDAFALVIIADAEAPVYNGLKRAVDSDAAHKDARAIDLSIAELRKIAPASGSYISESNFFNQDWQHEYWGDNYSRLLTIKKKYDPDGLFFVHHGVGSENWSADGFTRLT